MNRPDGSLRWLRDHNRARVLGVLRLHGKISQAEIARVTGLSRTTVSTLIGELKQSGLVIDGDDKAPNSRGGRPSVQLVFRSPALYVAGIDFGHSHVAVALSDLGHNVLGERRCDLDVNRHAIEALDMATRMFGELVAEVGADRGNVVAAGIGIPGPVDRARGMAGSATILPGWVGLRIAEEMRQRLGVAVEIENDANLGALAELTWGAGRDCGSFAYIKAATGIGAGIVINGQLLRGATGTAGEIGHTTLDEAGALCYCGNRGCLETVASGPAIVQLVGRVGGETLTLARVVDLAAAGDVRCRRAISDAGREIGVAVAGLCNLINPERVIIGGVLSRTGDVLLQPLRESVRRHAVQAAAERVDVRAAVFDERAELLGSLALALQSSTEQLAV
ncbi:MAG TPA: ROK family transcriptional regulator [Candidatus Dormibacteraeota bacterium]|nr:ROK family transcriptional regulator [Candidatus Dormibacteraeota bacterium]